MIDGFKREKTAKARKKLHCIACKRMTIHRLEARCRSWWNDPENPESGGSYYSILRCGACDEVCYETIAWSDNDLTYDRDGNAEPVERATQYPAPVSAHFDFNIEHTPRRLDDILDEMLYALAGSKTTLATIGLRLAVEFIVKDKNCAGRTLAHKINDLRTQELIDDNQKMLLHRIRERGNAGAHEAVGMNPEELIAGMSIIEGLLEKLYNGPARHAATIKKAMRLLNVDEEKEVDPLLEP